VQQNSASRLQICFTSYMRGLRKIYFQFIAVACLQGFLTMLALGQEMNREMELILKNFISVDLSDSIRMVQPINLDEKNITPALVGKTIDFFLTTRPWWWVENEPYELDNPRGEFLVIMNRFSKEFIPLFERLVETQYPRNCTNSTLLAQVTQGFDSFGNHFYEYANNKGSFQSAIVTPYMVGKAVSFLDDEDCVHKPNRFECAFLSATNCTYPDKLTKVRILWLIRVY